MTRVRTVSLLLVGILLLPTVLAQVGNRQANGDFEIAGDDPTDVPNWDLRGAIPLGGRLDNAGQQRDAVLALNGGSFATSEDLFPVTTSEILIFTVDARVVSGRAKVMLEFVSGTGSTVGLRSYDLASGADWVKAGAGSNVLVPAGALYGRVTLESYTADPAPGLSPPKQSGLALFDNVVVRNP